MKKLQNTRLATIADIPQILELIQEYLLQTPYKDYSVSLPRARGIVEALLIDDQNGCVAVSFVADRVVGVIVGHKITPTFSYEPVAVELLWYLTEEFRTPRRAYELLQVYEMWAKWTGCKWMQYAQLHVDSEPGEGARRGFTKTESHYQKRL